MEDEPSKPPFESFDIRTKIEQLQRQGTSGVINIGGRGMLIEFSPQDGIEELVSRVQRYYEDNNFEENTIFIESR